MPRRIAIDSQGATVEIFSKELHNAHVLTSRRDEDLDRRHESCVGRCFPFGMSLRYDSGPYTIGRMAGLLICLCGIPTGFPARAFPIDTVQTAPEASAASNAAPSFVDRVLVSDMGHAVSIPSVVLPAPGTIWSDPVETSFPSFAEARYLREIDGSAFPELPVPGPQLEFLTIAGLPYVTGLGYEPNDCNSTAGRGSCAATDDGLLELALMWAHGQSYRLEE